MCKRKLSFNYLLLIVLLSGLGSKSFATTDTLRVMAYNVLNYGTYPFCQGPINTYHGYLSTIVQFANPDIIGLEKLGSVNQASAQDFQDSITKYALEPAYPGRYTFCPFTNVFQFGTQCLVFYNQQKLGYVATTCTYSSTEDFTTYKLYYKDPNLSTTHDTTFLYVTDNHDISGNGNESQRGAQIAGEMAQIQTHFKHLANMINMGDFNIRNSSEQVYQTLTNPADTNFRYFDPPFYPDASVAYPADWDNNPNAFAKFLTTSTRQLGNVPNSCGTSGGGKDWYDHIFLSPWIIRNANYISYIPKSFRAIGNDGNRVGISVNDAPTNTSAPANVINALFQMSNKYPVMVDLLVTQNTTGISPADPEILNVSVPEVLQNKGHARVVNPVSSQLTVLVTDNLIGKPVTIDCIDLLGRTKMHQTLIADQTIIQLPCDLSPGNYFIRINNNENILTQTIVTKQ